MNQKRNTDRSRSLFTKALQLMEEGKFERAIELLKVAVSLDPENPQYTYEIAYAWFQLNDFQAALSEVQTVVDHPEATDLYPQLIGMAEEQLGNREAAREAYDRGLSRFPHSGGLYEKLGILEMGQGSMEKALEFWERGIMVDPLFPANYLRACRAFAYYKDKIPALLYGEIYLNLERNSYYASEIKRMLFSIYRQSIVFEDGMVAVDLNPKGLKIGEEGGWNEFMESYQLSLLAGAMQVRKKGTIRGLSKVREQFIEYWFGMGYHHTFPNILFHRHRHLIDLGLFEPYNLWLMNDGNPAEVKAWLEENEAYMRAFEEWFLENPLRVEKGYAFHRFMY